MKVSRILSLMLAAMMLAALCVGCTNTPAAPDASAIPGESAAPAGTQAPEVTAEPEATKPTDEGNGVLRYARTESIATLNPHGYTSDIESTCIEYTGATLYGYFPQEGSFTLKACLADGEPVQVDEEGRVWQVKISPDAKWANGEAMNADTFMYSFQMLLDPKLVNNRGAAFAEDYIKIENALAYMMGTEVEGAVPTWEQVGIKKIDDMTIEFTSTIAQNASEVMMHLAYVWTTPVYEPMYEELMNADRTATQYGTDIDKLVCSGAFVYGTWSRDAEITFVKNPGYIYKDLIYLAGVELKIVADAGTQLQMFENGELDYVTLSSDAYANYEEDPRVLYSPSITVKYITINQTNPNQPILGNLNFRKALFLSVDRESIAKLLSAKPANYMLSTRYVADVSTGLSYRASEQGAAVPGENYSFDTETAKQLFATALSEAGLDNVTVTMIYREEDAEMKTISEYLQKSWSELFGADKFELVLQGMPTNQANSQMRSFKTDAAAYELCWGGWSTNELAPWNGLKVYASFWGNRNEPFASERYDELWALANTSVERFDLNNRLAYTAGMEQIFLDDAAGIPVIEGVEKTLKADRVQLNGEWVSKIGFGWIYAQIVD